MVTAGVVVVVVAADMVSVLMRLAGGEVGGEVTVVVWSIVMSVVVLFCGIGVFGVVAVVVTEGGNGFN